ncbi:MAG TPA: AMP-binding protein [Amycolatopsis sp.]|nr:AMP-binding protein [Amycolatopsis sp.]
MSAPSHADSQPAGPPAAGAARPAAADLSDAAIERWPWIVSAPTVDRLLRLRAERTPDAPLLIDESGTTLTCADADRRVSRVAAALAAQGISAGTRVAWQLPTRISTVLVMLALRRLDAVQAPVIPLYREREVGAALETSRAEFLLIPGTWKGVDFRAVADAAAALAGCEDLRVLEIGHDAPEADPEPAPLASPDPDEPRWIYFTSGSTGRPKGALHSDTTLLVTARSFGGMGELNKVPGEIGAMGYPVAHVGGIEYLIAALACGFPILLLEAFVPDQAVRLFRQYGVTTTGGAPPFYTALLAMAAAQPGTPLLPSLRTLKGGGAPCPPDLVARVADELGAVLAHDYGMTEVPMVAIASPSDPSAVLAATDGRPIPDDHIRLVDDEGNVVTEQGGTGEVQVSGPGVCLGYTDPGENAAAFTADGWFRTGDLGTVHPSGHLEIIGRLKDMIIRKGENIAPQEIEALLAQHPAVAEVAVIGVPDADRGERVCAVVVPRADAEAPSLAALGEWLTGAGLMRQKLPERLEIVDALPRTGLAKVAKAELRRRFGENQ